MPIAEDVLERRILVLDGGATLNEARERVAATAERPRYLVVRLDGGFGATTIGDVARAIARLGPAGLDLQLDRLPVFATPGAAVERAAVGSREAERLCDRQPSRRLVVLEGGVPVGLVTNERRGILSGGLPTELFGASRSLLTRYLDDHAQDETCPYCGRSFAFYEIDAEQHAFACPYCHQVLLRD